MTINDNPFHVAYMQLMRELETVKPSKPVFIHEYTNHLTLSGKEHTIDMYMDDNGFYLNIYKNAWMDTVKVKFPLYKHVRFVSLGISADGFNIQLKEMA